ncbi:MAG: 6-phospho-beta-glucosidase, partial [Anaerolineae bacterium]|nr:6-phospho-beta-glucosidase [Anaerolineae bacterium]
MKLVIFGGGSSYTPELVDGLIRRYRELPVRELCLTDVDEQRLEILAGLTRRMLARAGLPVQVTATADRRRALEGADWV